MDAITIWIGVCIAVSMIVIAAVAVIAVDTLKQLRQLKLIADTLARASWAPAPIEPSDPAILAAVNQIAAEERKKEFEARLGVYDPEQHIALEAATMRYVNRTGNYPTDDQRRRFIEYGEDFSAGVVDRSGDEEYRRP